MGFEGLADRYARVQEEVAAAQARAGIAGPVRIVAVTKGHPVEAIAAARDAGLTDVGENRVQEALEKQEHLGLAGLEWHMIGHLQSNKAKDVPGRFAVVHSVDSVKLGLALVRAVERAGTTAPLAVLVQVNVAGEAQKSGCPPERLGEVLAELGSHAQLTILGLMTMAPFTDDERVQRAAFAGLRALRDRHSSTALPLRELSMGMSGDYLSAVAEGATMLRLGTVLLGERPR